MKAWVGTKINAWRFQIWTPLIALLLKSLQPDIALRSANHLLATVTSRLMIGGPPVQPLHLCRRQLLPLIEAVRFC
jgi:hypothetical protein